MKHNEIDQALPYEFGRNFWFYSPQLAYRDGADASSVITGYAVFMRFLALDAAGAKLGPFRGRSGKEFRREVERLVDLYVADPALNWENTLKRGAAPAIRWGWAGPTFSPPSVSGFAATTAVRSTPPGCGRRQASVRPRKPPRTRSTTSWWRPAWRPERTWARCSRRRGVGRFLTLPKPKRPDWAAAKAG